MRVRRAGTEPVGSGAPLDGSERAGRRRSGQPREARAAGQAGAAGQARATRDAGAAGDAGAARKAREAGAINVGSVHTDVNVGYVQIQVEAQASSSEGKQVRKIEVDRNGEIPKGGSGVKVGKTTERYEPHLTQTARGARSDRHRHRSREAPGLASWCPEGARGTGARSGVAPLRLGTLPRTTARPVRRRDPRPLRLRGQRPERPNMAPLGWERGARPVLLGLLVAER